MKAEDPVRFQPATAAQAWLGQLAARGIEYLFANGGTDFAPMAEAYAAGRDVAGLHPVVHHGAVELERAGHVGLTAENSDQPLGAVHGVRV